MVKTIGSLNIKIKADIDDIKKAEQATENLGKEGNKSSKEFDKLGREGKQAGDKVQKGAKIGERSLKSMRISAASAGKALAAMTKGIGIVIAAGTGFVALVNQAAGVNDEMTKLAASTGVSVEEMERLSWAASQSGASADVLSKSIRFLNKGLADAASKGTGPVYEGLVDVGLSLADLQGSAEENLGAVADALNKIEDPAKRATMAAKILGQEGGPKMASMLAEGSAGINKLGNEAVKSSQEQRKAFTEFVDKMAEIMAMLSKLLLDVLEPLLPMITKIAEKLGEMLSNIMKSGAMDKLISAFEVVIDLVFEILNELMPVIDELEKSGLLDSMLETLKILSPMIMDLLKFLVPILKTTINLWKSLNDVLNIISDLIAQIVKHATELYKALTDWLGTLDVVNNMKNGVKRLANAVDGFRISITRSKDETEKLKGSLMDAISLRRQFNKLGETKIGKKIFGAIEEEGIEAEAEAAQEAAAIEIQQKTTRNIQLVNKAREEGLNDIEFQELKSLGFVGEEELQTFKPKKKGKGGGKKKKKDKEVTSEVTFAEALTALRSGDGSAAQFAAVAKSLSTKTPEAEDIKPTIALTFFNFENKFNIEGSNGEEIAENVIEAMKKTMRDANAKAGNVMQIALIG